MTAVTAEQLEAMISVFEDSIADGVIVDELEIAPLLSLAREVERLRVAIAWVLGESPEGAPEFEPRAEGQPPYWWRAQLRKLAGAALEDGT